MTTLDFYLKFAGGAQAQFARLFLPALLKKKLVY